MYNSIFKLKQYLKVLIFIQQQNILLIQLLQRYTAEIYYLEKSLLSLKSKIAYFLFMLVTKLFKIIRENCQHQLLPKDDFCDEVFSNFFLKVHKVFFCIPFKICCSSILQLIGFKIQSLFILINLKRMSIAIIIIHYENMISDIKITMNRFLQLRDIKR